jgi:hypothetical protein
VLESTTSVQINHPRFKSRYPDRLLASLVSSGPNR